MLTTRKLSPPPETCAYRSDFSYQPDSESDTLKPRVGTYESSIIINTLEKNYVVIDFEGRVRDWSNKKDICDVYPDMKFSGASSYQDMDEYFLMMKNDSIITPRGIKTSKVLLPAF